MKRISVMDYLNWRLHYKEGRVDILDRLKVLDLQQWLETSAGEVLSSERVEVILQLVEVWLELDKITDTNND